MKQNCSNLQFNPVRRFVVISRSDGWNKIDGSSGILVRNFSTDNFFPDKVKDNLVGTPMSKGEGVSNIYKGWKLPLYSSWIFPVNYKNSIAENKYLDKQYKRIMKKIQAGETEKAIKIWIVLFQRSASYMLFSFNKALTGWYFRYSEVEVREVIRDVVRIRKSWDANAVFRRVYIEKNNGKLRPLGVPDKAWRVILHQLNWINTCLLEPSVGDYQFGFRPRRNVWQIWNEILRKITIEKKKCYEFDLEACFNRISLNTSLSVMYDKKYYEPFRMYMRSLLTTSPVPAERREEDQGLYPLSSWGVVKKSLRHSMQRLDVDELMLHLKVVWNGPHVIKGKVIEGSYYVDKDDKELVSIRSPSMFNIRWLKFGMPQGWSLSPLLAITTIDVALKEVKWDTLMYADDGLIFGDDEDAILSEINWDKLAPFGLYPSTGLKKDGTPKCGMVNKYLSFLGLKYNIIDDEFEIEGLWGKRTPENLERIQELYQGDEELFDDYGRGSRKKIAWTWNVNSHSWMARQFPVMSWTNLWFLLLYLCRKGSIRRFGFRFIPVPLMSSLAVNDFFNSLNYSRIRKQGGKTKSIQKIFDSPPQRRPEPVYLDTEGWPLDYSGPAFFEITTDLDLFDRPCTTGWRAMIDRRKRGEESNYGGQILYQDPIEADNDWNFSNR